MKIVYASFLSLSLITGCAGKLDYTPPSTQYKYNNEIILQSSFDESWKKSIPILGKNFFVINNIDKDSGIINISYSGSPEKYIDCGVIKSYVKNARGEREYIVQGNMETSHYEVMNEGLLYSIQREMSLEGRINLIFEEIDSANTKVTANTKYIVERSLTVSQAGQNFSRQNKDTISFNSGQSGSFPAANDGRAASCSATGTLEEELLNLLQI